MKEIFLMRSHGSSANISSMNPAAQTAWANQAEEASRDALRERITEDRETYPTLAAHLSEFLGDWDSQFDIAAQALIAGLAAHRA